MEYGGILTAGYWHFWFAHAGNLTKTAVSAATPVQLAGHVYEHGQFCAWHALPSSEAEPWAACQC